MNKIGEHLFCPCAEIAGKKRSEKFNAQVLELVPTAINDLYKPPKILRMILLMNGVHQKETATQFSPKSARKYFSPFILWSMGKSHFHCVEKRIILTNILTTFHQIL